MYQDKPMRKHAKLLLPAFLLLVASVACNSSDLIKVWVRPTPTPTFVLGRFITPTSTPTPANNTSQNPGPTATPTAKPSPTENSIPETPEPGDEGQPDESTFESPVLTPTPAPSPTPAAPTDTPPPPTATPTDTPVPTPAPLAGRIAFPVDDGGGRYDVWVVELPDGEPFLVQVGARQPNFSNDGRLLVNLQNSPRGDSIGLIDASYAWQRVVNDSPDDAYPFWHPDGGIYAYSNANLLIDPATGNPLPHVFIPCSMQMPSFENNEKCRDIKTRGKVAIGQAPVWTEDDRIAFWTFEGDDGIYVVSGVSALWDAGGVGSKELLATGNGLPTDTDGFQVFFSAGNIDGNWEAYAIDLDGSNLVNLSNAPNFQDGLPAVSPDGDWVAFVSDRDGKWGIWAVPRAGGEPEKIVDISKINTNPSPWGTGNRAWMNERISWGP